MISNFKDCVYWMKSIAAFLFNICFPKNMLFYMLPTLVTFTCIISYIQRPSLVKVTSTYTIQNYTAKLRPSLVRFFCIIKSLLVLQTNSNLLIYCIIQVFI